MARTKDFDEDEVLNKAINLFWHKGYNATSMQDLVAGLGISRSSLYDTYGDKHTLFVKALERYQNANNKQMDEIVNEAASAKEAVQKLLSLAANKPPQACELPKGCFLINTAVEIAQHDETISRIIDENDAQMQEYFFKAVKKGQANNEISKAKDATAISRFLMNTLKGMGVTAKLTADKQVFNDIVEVALSVLN